MVAPPPGEFDYPLKTKAGLAAKKQAKVPRTCMSFRIMVYVYLHAILTLLHSHNHTPSPHRTAPRSAAR